MSKIRYAHVNIVAKDWKNLMNFYVDVFDCEPVSSERNHKGQFAEDLTNLPDVRIVGQHLRVPGHGENGPTIEIFTFDPQLDNPGQIINRPGFGHIAFEVDDFEGVREQVVKWGGKDYGKKVTVDIDGAGQIFFLQYLHSIAVLLLHFTALE